MTPEATLWAETQRLPLVACPGDDRERGCRKRWLPNPETSDPEEWWAKCLCGGTGEVRSDVYRAIKRAITVPLDCSIANLGLYGKPNAICIVRDCCEGTGRVLRLQPGVIACEDCDGEGHWKHGLTPLREGLSEEAVCATCEGSGTVPDPSEAGVVARAQACGLLHAVVQELPLTLEEQLALERLVWNDDYDGALAATLEAVRARVPA